MVAISYVRSLELIKINIKKQKYMNKDFLQFYTCEIARYPYLNLSSSFKKGKIPELLVDHISMDGG